MENTKSNINQFLNEESQVDNLKDPRISRRAQSSISILPSNNGLETYEKIKNENNLKEYEKNEYYVKIDEYIEYIEEICKNYTKYEILSQYDSLKKEIRDEKNYLKLLIDQITERKSALSDFDNFGIQCLIDKSHANVESFFKQASKDFSTQTNWSFNELKINNLLIAEKMKNFIPIINFIEMKKKVRFGLEEIREEFEFRSKHCVIYSYEKLNEIQTRIENGDFSSRRSIENNEKNEFISDLSDISNIKNSENEKNIGNSNENSFDTVKGIEPEPIENQNEEESKSELNPAIEHSVEILNKKEEKIIEENIFTKGDKGLELIEVSNVTRETNELESNNTNDLIGNLEKNISDEILVENNNQQNRIDNEDEKIINKNNFTSNEQLNEKDLTNQIVNLMQKKNLIDLNNSDCTYPNKQEEKFIIKNSKEKIKISDTININAKKNAISKINIIDIDLSSTKENKGSKDKSSSKKELSLQTLNTKKGKEFSSNLKNRDSNEKLKAYFSKAKESKNFTASPKKINKTKDQRTLTPTISRNTSILENSISKDSANKIHFNKKKQMTNLVSVNYIKNLKPVKPKNQESDNFLQISHDVSDINRSKISEFNKNYMPRTSSALFSNRINKNHKNSLNIRSSINESSKNTNKSLIENSKKNNIIDNKRNFQNKDDSDNSIIHKKNERKTNGIFSSNKEINPNTYSNLSHKNTSLEEKYIQLSEKISKNLMSKRIEKSTSLLTHKKLNNLDSIKNSNILHKNDNNHKNNLNDIDKKYLEFPSKLKKNTYKNYKNQENSYISKQNKKASLDIKVVNYPRFSNLKDRLTSENKFSIDISSLSNHSVVRDSNLNDINEVVDDNKIEKDKSKIKKKILTDNMKIDNKKTNKLDILSKKIGISISPKKKILNNENKRKSNILFRVVEDNNK